MQNMTLKMTETTRRGVLHTIVFAVVSCALALFFFSQCDSSVFLIGSAIIVLVSVIGYFLILTCDHVALYKRFGFAALVTGLIFVFVFPPISVPDEMYHYTASHWYASSMLGESSILDSSSFSMRAEDRDFIDMFTEGNVSYKEYEEVVSSLTLLQSVDVSESVEGYAFDLGSNPPQLKLPSAIAVLIARLLHLGAVPLFYLGRMFNLLYFIVLASCAIRIAPIGKSIFCAISMLPMTLHLAASYSYDAGILGLSFLFVALLMKAIFTDGPIERREIAYISIVAILLAPCKVIYSFAVGMVLFIPNNRFTSRRQAIMFKCALPLMMVFSVALLRLPAMLTMASGSAGPQTHDGVTGNYYTLSTLVTHPVASVLMLCKTVYFMFDFYWISAIGGSLSRFQGSLAAPHYLVAIYLVMLVVSTFPEHKDEKGLSGLARGVAIACFLLSVLGSMVAMWIGWTFDSESIIQGVQGRYFLPLLPLFLIAVRPRKIVASFSVSTSIIDASFVLNSLYMIYILFCAFSFVG